jgi:hypothetical protein
MLYPARYYYSIPLLMRRGLLQSKNYPQLVWSPDAVAVVVTHAHQGNQKGPLFMVTLELVVVLVRKSLSMCWHLVARWRPVSEQEGQRSTSGT